MPIGNWFWSGGLAGPNRPTTKLTINGDIPDRTKGLEQQKIWRRRNMIGRGIFKNSMPLKRTERAYLRRAIRLQLQLDLQDHYVPRSIAGLHRFFKIYVKGFQSQWFASKIDEYQINGWSSATAGRVCGEKEPRGKYWSVSFNTFSFLVAASALNVNPLTIDRYLCKMENGL